MGAKRDGMRRVVRAGDRPRSPSPEPFRDGPRSLVIRTVRERLTGNCGKRAEAYPIRNAGPETPAMQISEMAKRFRASIVNMGRPLRWFLERPHASDPFQDDCFGCFGASVHLSRGERARRREAVA